MLTDELDKLNSKLRQIKRLEQAGEPAGLSSVLAGNRDFSP